MVHLTFCALRSTLVRVFHNMAVLFAVSFSFILTLSITLKLNSLIYLFINFKKFKNLGFNRLCILLKKGFTGACTPLKKNKQKNI